MSTEVMTAEQFARLCAFMEYPVEDVAAELQKDPFNLTAHEADELARTTVRAWQEGEIGDEHAIIAEQVQPTKEG